MTPNLIASGIKNVLDPLKTNDKVQEIYDYASPERLGNPRIEITHTNFESQRFTNQHRIETYTHEIRITQDVSEQVRPTAKEAHDRLGYIREDAKDLLDAEMEASSPFLGYVDYIESIDGIENRETVNGGVVVATLSVTSVKLNS